MSALLPKMSALGVIADIRRQEWHVRFGPKADIKGETLDRSRYAISDV
jgi:hypothetical protein